MPLCLALRDSMRGSLCVSFHDRRLPGPRASKPPDESNRAAPPNTHSLQICISARNSLRRYLSSMYRWRFLALIAFPVQGHISIVSAQAGISLSSLASRATPSVCKIPTCSSISTASSQELHRRGWPPTKIMHSWCSGDGSWSLAVMF